MSKTKSKVKRRFTKGDGVHHVAHGTGNVWQGSVFDDTLKMWVCMVEFTEHPNDVQLRHQLIPESELQSRPELAQRKYGQGKEGCRVGPSRYGKK